MFINADLMFRKMKKNLRKTAFVVYFISITLNKLHILKLSILILTKLFYLYNIKK